MTPWRIVLGSCRANSRWVGSFVFRIYIYLTFPRNWIEMKICLKWNAYELCGKTGSEIPCIELIWKVYRNVSWNAMHELIYDAYVWIGAVDAQVRIDLWCICMKWCGGRTGEYLFLLWWCWCILSSNPAPWFSAYSIHRIARSPWIQVDASRTVHAEWVRQTSRESVSEIPTGGWP